MAVATVTAWRPEPGKREELIQLFKNAKVIHERHGGRVRMWAAGMSGPNVGTLTYVIEHDDMAALARFGEKLATDADWQAMVPMLSAGTPGTIISHSQVVEIL